jgi:c-di-AMP phosphodiesterase-like protein
MANLLRNWWKGWRSGLKNMEIIIFLASLFFSLLFIVVGWILENANIVLIGSITLMVVGVFLFSSELQSYNEYVIYNETLDYEVVTNTQSFGDETSTPIGIMILFWGAILTLYAGRIFLYGGGSS